MLEAHCSTDLLVQSLILVSMAIHIVLICWQNTFIVVILIWSSYYLTLRELNGGNWGSEVRRLVLSGKAEWLLFPTVMHGFSCDLLGQHWTTFMIMAPVRYKWAISQYGELHSTIFIQRQKYLKLYFSEGLLLLKTTRLPFSLYKKAKLRQCSFDFHIPHVAEQPRRLFLSLFSKTKQLLKEITNKNKNNPQNQKTKGGTQILHINC